MSAQVNSLQETDDRLDATILTLLLDPDLHPPLTRDEIARIVGDSLSVGDSLARLHADGLVTRNGDCCFPTRAARRFANLGVLVR